MTDTNTLAVAAPDTALADRLAAAEQDTGFKLAARVTIPGTNHGVLSVVGFARVNVPGIDTPVRCVAVSDPDALRQHGVETVILFTADKLLAAPPQREPPPQ